MNKEKWREKVVLFYTLKKKETDSFEETCMWYTMCWVQGIMLGIRIKQK